MKKKKVVWSERAQKFLIEHYDHIKEDSVSAAKRVKSEIINASNWLNVHPEKYQLDELAPGGGINTLSSSATSVVGNQVKKATE